MSRFFHKIRQNLLAQNRLTRYLIYALGEIVLVVIGILIALQLNIKKEEASEKKLLNELLLGVQADLKLERERIEFLEAYYGDLTDGIQKIILHQQDIENYSNQELGEYFLHTLEFRKFSKYNTNYQTLYGSGMLQKIAAKNLSEEIITYYTRQYLEWSLAIYQEKAGSLSFNNTSQFYPLDKLHSSVSYAHIPNFRIDTEVEYETDFEEFTKEPEVLNFLVDLLHQSELVFSNLKNYKDLNEILSNRIQRYLEQ